MLQGEQSSYSYSPQLTISVTPYVTLFDVTNNVDAYYICVKFFCIRNVEREMSKNVLNIPMPKKGGELTDDESNFILTSTLGESRRADPLVLQFIDVFLRCKNIAQASAECGISNTVGYRMRHYVDVSLAIQKLTDKSAIKYGFDASEIMERTKEIVDFDPIMVQNPDGSFKNNFHDIAPEIRRSIKKMEVKNIWSDSIDANGLKSKIIIGEVIKFEFYDKIKAIELAGKEKEMFKNTTKVEHTVSKDMRTILLASSALADEANKTIEMADVIEVK